MDRPHRARSHSVVRRRRRGSTAGSAPASTAVSGPGELVALVPYLLGFVPTESLTVIGMRDGHVALTARVDLPPGGVGRALLTELFHGVLGPLAQHRVVSAYAVVHSDRPSLDPDLPPVLAEAASTLGVDLLDLVWHREDRVLPLLCDDPRCCPPAGVPVARSCDAVAHATYEGMLVAPSRTDVEREFVRPAGVVEVSASVLEAVPVPGADAESLLDLAREVDVAVELGLTAPRVDDEEVAWLLVGLTQPAVRDAVWLAVDSREVHGQGLWLELAHRAPGRYAAAPLFLLGWRSWRRGDGVRATLAAEASLAAVPGGYSAARLLLDTLDHVVDPASVPLLSDHGLQPGVPA